MRKFDLSLRSSRSSYFATFRHQLTILSKTDALDEEKWLNMLGTFVKDWFRYESHFVHGRDSLVRLFVNVFSHIETNSHITGSFKRLTFSINRPQPTRTLPPREISMKDVFRSGDSSKKFKIAEGQWYRYAPSYVSPAYHLLEGFPFIQEPPSGDLQERVLIRHHDYDQCFQSVQLLQWN